MRLDEITKANPLELQPDDIVYFVKGIDLMKAKVVKYHPESNKYELKYYSPTYRDVLRIRVHTVNIYTDEEEAKFAGFVARMG